MSFTITENFVKSYASNLYMRAAQVRSLFESAVRLEMNVVGRMKSFDRLDSLEGEEDTTRHGDTPMHDITHDRVWAVLRDWIAAPVIDDEDKLKMLIDPTSEYVDRVAQSANRYKDDRVIAAFNADVVTGENFDGTSSFDTTNYRIASGSVGLTPLKLRQSMEKLRAGEVQMEEDFYLTCAPKQIYTDLMNFPELTNNDYNTIRTLVEGKIGAFMGFKFIMSNRLGTVSGERACYAWAKSGMGLAIAKERSTDIVRRPDKKNNPQIIAKQSMGAVRIEQAKVVQVLCTE
jgi:hypothetical protein